MISTVQMTIQNSEKLSCLPCHILPMIEPRGTAPPPRRWPHKLAPSPACHAACLLRQTRAVLSLQPFSGSEQLVGQSYTGQNGGEARNAPPLQSLGGSSLLDFFPVGRQALDT